MWAGPTASEPPRCVHLACDATACVVAQSVRGKGSLVRMGIPNACDGPCAAGDVEKLWLCVAGLLCCCVCALWLRSAAPPMTSCPLSALLVPRGTFHSYRCEPGCLLSLL